MFNADANNFQEHKKEFINSLFCALQNHFPTQFQTQVLAQAQELNTAILESVLDPLLNGFVNKLNLVTRQEFDIQCQVLLRTRLKIESLEQEIEKLQQTQQNLIPVSELNQK